MVEGVPVTHMRVRIASAACLAGFRGWVPRGHRRRIAARSCVLHRDSCPQSNHFIANFADDLNMSLRSPGDPFLFLTPPGCATMQPAHCRAGGVRHCHLAAMSRTTRRPRVAEHQLPAR